MNGYKLNEDTEHVTKIINGLHKKQGHCPCRLNKDATTLCPCDEFIHKGDCKCDLFVKIEDAN